MEEEEEKKNRNIILDGDGRLLNPRYSSVMLRLTCGYG